MRKEIQQMEYKGIGRTTILANGIEWSNRSEINTDNGIEPDKKYSEDNRIIKLKWSTKSNTLQFATPPLTRATCIFIENIAKQVNLSANCPPHPKIQHIINPKQSTTVTNTDRGYFGTWNI